MGLSNYNTKVGRAKPVANLLKSMFKPTVDDAISTAKLSQGKTDAFKVDTPMEPWNPVRLATQPFGYGNNPSAKHPFLRTTAHSGISKAVNKAGELPGYMAWNGIKNTPAGRTALRATGTAGLAGTTHTYNNLGDIGSNALQADDQATYGYSFDENTRNEIARIIDKNKAGVTGQLAEVANPLNYFGNVSKEQQQRLAQSKLAWQTGGDYLRQIYGSKKIPFGTGLNEGYQKYGVPGAALADITRRGYNKFVATDSANSYRMSPDMQQPLRNYYNTILPNRGESGVGNRINDSILSGNTDFLKSELLNTGYSSEDANAALNTPLSNFAKELAPTYYNGMTPQHLRNARDSLGAKLKTGVGDL